MALLELGLSEALRAAEADDMRLRQRAPRQGGHRNYLAARRTRLNADFITDSGQSQLPHVYRSLRTLRTSSRKLAKNNGYFIKFLRMCRRNVVGPNGMSIQSQAYTRRGDKLDKTLNALVDQHWTTWSHPENASANGRQSWLDLQLKWITMLARDGEFLARKIPADNPYGFAIKILDPAWLDETYSETRPNGNRVIMSVEIDNNDRPVRYWLTPPADASYAGIQPLMRRRTPVAAEDIYHHFLPFDQNCGDDTITRGIPWAHSAMLKLWSMGAFEESAIIAARLGASKMGFFKKQKDELGFNVRDMRSFLPQTTKGDEEDEDRENGPRLSQHVVPGQFDIIDDYEFQSFDPKYPSDMVKPFMSAMLHGVAADLGPEYFTFASDLTEVNFSAGRLGVEEERDGWLVIQGFGREHLVRPVRLDWTRSSMISGALTIGPNEIERLTEPKIEGRRWGYYDPSKDVDADEKKIKLGLTNRRKILAKLGESDVEEVLEGLQQEDELAAEYGVDISGSGPAAATPAAEPPPADPNDPNATGQ